MWGEDGPGAVKPIQALPPRLAPAVGLTPELMLPGLVQC